MDAEKITLVLNEIAKQIGVAADFVVPALVRYKIAGYAINLIWFVLLAVITFITVKTVIKITNKYDNDGRINDGDEFIVTICGVVSVFSGVFMFLQFAEGLNIIKWLIAPEGSVINYVLEMLK